MFEDLLLIVQQVIVTAGSAVAVVVALTVARYLVRLASRVAPQVARSWRYALDLGAARISVAVTISRTPGERKSIPDKDDE